MPTTRRSSLSFQLALVAFGKEILVSGENLAFMNAKHIATSNKNPARRHYLYPLGHEAEDHLRSH